MSLYITEWANKYNLAVRFCFAGLLIIVLICMAAMAKLNHLPNSINTDQMLKWYDASIMVIWIIAFFIAVWFPVLTMNRRRWCTQSVYLDLHIKMLKEANPAVLLHQGDPNDTVVSLAEKIAEILMRRIGGIIPQQVRVHRLSISSQDWLKDNPHHKCAVVLKQVAGEMHYDIIDKTGSILKILIISSFFVSIEKLLLSNTRRRMAHAAHKVINGIIDNLNTKSSFETSSSTQL